MPKEIMGIIPLQTAINERLTDFILWVSDYYMALPGEVMKAAIPSADDLVSRSVPRKKLSPDNNSEAEVILPAELNALQNEAYTRVKELFNNHEGVLLHGVTSSGKTEIYIHLIRDQLAMGRQVLYMLPEIALTTQIIERLQKHFGAAIGVYHSRLTPAARQDVWRRAGNGSLSAVLGVRSSLFLPFKDLGLIIVDEEHDSSYKQYDPAPRYHARDAAMMLSRIHGGVTLLGSATPSVESYYNATSGRYGLVGLTARYGDVKMPEMIVADTRSHGKKKKAVSHFSSRMLDAIGVALAKGEQVILFQNR
jgi:primosomal protein N' (replication factor Y)